MVTLVMVVAAAALWRPVRFGAILLAGAVIPMAAQAISALILVSEPVSAADFGISPAQATQAGLTISPGLTAAFWIYCVFVVALLMIGTWMALPQRPVSYSAYGPASRPAPWPGQSPWSGPAGVGTAGPGPAGPRMAAPMPTGPAGPVTPGSVTAGEVTEHGGQQVPCNLPGESRIGRVEGPDWRPGSKVQAGKLGPDRGRARPGPEVVGQVGEVDGRHPPGGVHAEVLVGGARRAGHPRPRY